MPANIQINEKRLLDLIQNLVKINSEYSEGVIQNHQEIARFLAEYSSDIGLEVHVAEPESGYPVVMTKLAGTANKPVLAFIGHYNTHPIGDLSQWTIDPIGGIIKDDYIWGRGVADMKKNLAAAIEATHAVMEANIDLKGDLVLIWFAGEGHHDSALEYMAGEGRAFAPVDWYIDMDWCEGDIAKVAGPWVWMKIQTQGLNSHSALFRGDGKKPINAISKMAHLICEMEQVDNWMTYKTHELFDETWRYSTKPIVEANIINGGQKINEVAGSCSVEVDFRLLPGQSPKQLLKELNVLIEKLRDDDEDLMPVKMEVLKTTYSRDFEFNDDHPVIKAIHQSAKAVTGRIPDWRGLLFGSRPPLWEVAEVIHFGLAGGRNYHGFDESTGIKELIEGANIYVGIIESLLN